MLNIALLLIFDVHSGTQLWNQLCVLYREVSLMQRWVSVYSFVHNSTYVVRTVGIIGKGVLLYMERSTIVIICTYFTVNMDRSFA